MGRVTREEIARAMAVHSMSDDIRTDADVEETEGVVVTDVEASSTDDEAHASNNGHAAQRRQ